MDVVILVGLPIVALILIVEGIRGSKHSKTVGEFFLLGGKLQLGRYVGTFAATNFSLGNMIFLSLIWGAYFGWGGILWLWVGFILAAIVYAQTIKRSVALCAYLENQDNSGSVHEFLAQRFARTGTVWATRLRLLASLTTITGLLVALTLELYIAAQLLAPVIQAEVPMTFVAMTVLICVYATIGGFWSVVATDVVQGVLIILAFIGIGIVVLQLELPLSSYTETYSAGIILAPGWAGILSIIGVTFGWFLVTMDTWQRSCAARRAKIIVPGLYLGTGALLIGILIFGMLGMYDILALAPSLNPEQAAQHSGGLNPITDLYLVADGLGSLGTLSLGVIVLALVMAGLSTADTFLIVAGHSFVSDLMVGISRKASFGDLSDAEATFYAGMGRTVIVVMGACVVLLYFLLRNAGLMENPLILFFLAYSLQFALLAPVVVGLGKNVRATGGAAFASVLVGFLTALGWGFGFAISKQHGLTTALGVTVDELIYLTPIPTIILGTATLLIFSVGRPSIQTTGRG